MPSIGFEGLDQTLTAQNNIDSTVLKGSAAFAAAFSQLNSVKHQADQDITVKLNYSNDQFNKNQQNQQMLKTAQAHDAAVLESQANDRFTNMVLKFKAIDSIFNTQVDESMALRTLDQSSKSDAIIDKAGQVIGAGVLENQSAFSAKKIAITPPETGITNALANSSALGQVNNQANTSNTVATALMLDILRDRKKEA